MSFANGWGRGGTGWYTGSWKWFLGLALVFALVFTQCGKEDIIAPVNNLNLSKTISSAITLLINSSEGTAGGNYTRGSRAILITSITGAQTTYANKVATQADLDQAQADLETAMAEFKSKIVVEIDPENLVAQWTFDQIPVASAGVIVADASGHKHDGTINTGVIIWGGGTPSVVLDRYGVDSRALHFNRGSNLEIPYIADINPATMSLAFWLNVDVTQQLLDNQYLISLNRAEGFILNYQKNQRLTFSANSSQGPGTYITGDNNGSLTPGTWYHLVITVGDGHLRFYVNGVLVQDWVRPGTIAPSLPVNLVFGQDLPNNSYSFDSSGDPHYFKNGGYYAGALDEVRMYKSVLTNAQVASIYNLEKP